MGEDPAKNLQETPEDDDDVKEKEEEWNQSRFPHQSRNPRRKKKVFLELDRDELAAVRDRLRSVLELHRMRNARLEEAAFFEWTLQALETRNSSIFVPFLSFLPSAGVNNGKLKKSLVLTQGLHRWKCVKLLRRIEQISDDHVVTVCASEHRSPLYPFVALRLKYDCVADVAQGSNRLDNLDVEFFSLDKEVEAEVRILLNSCEKYAGFQQAFDLVEKYLDEKGWEKGSSLKTEEKSLVSPELNSLQEVDLRPSMRSRRRFSIKRQKDAGSEEKCSDSERCRSVEKDWINSADDRDGSNVSFNKGNDGNDVSLSKKDGNNNSIRYFSPERIGLRNRGNTCYINSVLQCLFGIPMFLDDLTSFAEQLLPVQTAIRYRSSRRRGEETTTTSMSIAKMLSFLARQRKQARSLGAPMQNFKRTFETFYPSFKGCEQQDAHEFLINLFSKINDEAEAPLEVAGRANSSPVKLNFEFSLVETKTCQRCQHSTEHLTRDTVLRITASFFNEPHRTMQDLLKETLLSTADLACSNCLSNSRTTRNAVKRTSLHFVSERFHRLPRVLVLFLPRIDFERFSQTTTKRSDPVSVSQVISLEEVSSVDGERHLFDSIDLERLSLGNNVVEEEQESMSLRSRGRKESNEITVDDSSPLHRYRWTGAVNHLGETTESGHYVAKVFSTRKQKWFHYNDDFVTETSLDSVLRECSTNGYLFFYTHEAYLNYGT